MTEVKLDAEIPAIDVVVAEPVVEAPAKKSIKELKEVLLLAVDVVNSALMVAKDGKVGLDDLGAVLKLIPMIGPALDGAGEIPAELKDIDDAEAAELVGAVVGRLAIEDEKARLVVEKALKLLQCVLELVLVLKK